MQIFNDELSNLLATQNLSEVIINEDGKVFIETSSGKSQTKLKLKRDEIEKIICLVASSKDLVCNKENPIISCELESGFRFQGSVYPVVNGASICIRKGSNIIYNIDELCKNFEISNIQRDFIVKSVIERQNILISGSTSSGKTCFLNSLLSVIPINQRLVVLEDTREIKANLPDITYLKTGKSTDLKELVKTALRLRPDRIVVGEVRGIEALDLIKAWNTGHPGGLTTIHADSCERSILRLEQLVSESGLNYKKEIIQTINVVIHLEKIESKRQLSEICRIVIKGNDFELEYI